MGHTVLMLWQMFKIYWQISYEHAQIARALFSDTRWADMCSAGTVWPTSGLHFVPYESWTHNYEHSALRFQCNLTELSQAEWCEHWSWLQSTQKNPWDLSKTSIGISPILAFLALLRAICAMFGRSPAENNIYFNTMWHFSLDIYLQAIFVGTL